MKSTIELLKKDENDLLNHLREKLADATALILQVTENVGTKESQKSNRKTAISLTHLRDLFGELKNNEGLPDCDNDLLDHFRDEVANAVSLILQSTENIGTEEFQKSSRETAVDLAYARGVLNELKN